MTKMPAMFLLVACAAVVAQRGVPLRAAEIRHRFLAVVKGYAGGLSARRLQDGRTILACNTQGVRFYEVFFEMARETIFTLACLRVNGEA